MIDISTSIIKKLRDETGAGVMNVRTALKKANGNEEAAKKILKEKGLEKIAEKAHRKTDQGVIETYIHADGKIGAMVHLACETDFVARTAEFRELAKELAMQIAAMDPKDTDELLSQEYIRDSSRSVKELLAEVVAKTGENIKVKKISRFALGE